MRKILLAVILVSGFGMSAYTQTEVQTVVSGNPRSYLLPISVTFRADSVQRTPTQDAALGKQAADFRLTLSGNVIIEINGVQITADSAAWNSGSSQIELNGGSVRIDLPGPPTPRGSIAR